MQHIMNKVQFGKNLRASRRSAGLTQLQLGERVGVSNMSIYFYESAQSVPPLPRFVALCDALRVSPEKLLFGLQSETAPPPPVETTDSRPLEAP